MALIKFNPKSNGHKKADTIAEVVKAIDGSSARPARRNPNWTSSVITLESAMSDSQVREWMSAKTNINTSTVDIIQALGNEDYDDNPIAYMSAAYAVAMSQDPVAFLRTKVINPTVSTEKHHILIQSIHADSEDQVRKGVFSNEVFDEQATSELFSYNIAFNLGVSLQSEFGAAFYPTVVGSPSATGLDVTVGIPVLQSSEITHDNKGTPTDFKYINLLRAVADPSILAPDNTELVPIWRDNAETKKYFVDQALVPPRTIVKGNAEIVTAPLKIGVTHNLLGISQPDAMLARGVNDFTDTIHPSGSVRNIYIKVGNDIIRMSLKDMMGSTYNGAWQGNQRGVTLNFDGTQLAITPVSTQFNDTAMVTLAPLVTDKLSVRLHVGLSGNLNLATGAGTVYSNKLEVYSIINSDGEELGKTDAKYTAIAALFTDAEVIGFDPLNYRTNLNRRQLGTLVDQITYRQQYQVPLRSPISAVRPTSDDTSNEATDINTLVGTISSMIEQEAVESIFEHASNLATIVQAKLDGRDPDDIRSIGGALVKPYYKACELDLIETVDSLTSFQRTMDIRASLINTIKVRGYEMWIKSEFQAALNYYYSGASNLRPTILVAIDPIYASFLDGLTEVETVGMQRFPIKIVTTLNKRMANNMFITLMYGDAKKGEFQPLQMGFMAYFPELVMVTQTFRNNRSVKELTVHPRFQIFNHLPVLTHVNLSNLDKVLEKMNLHIIDKTP